MKAGGKKNIILCLIAQPVSMFNSLEKAAQIEQSEMLLSWQGLSGGWLDSSLLGLPGTHTKKTPAESITAGDRHKLSEEAKVGEEEREMKRRKPSSKCSSVIRKIH